MSDMIDPATELQNAISAAAGGNAQPTTETGENTPSTNGGQAGATNGGQDGGAGGKTDGEADAAAKAAKQPGAKADESIKDDDVLALFSPKETPDQELAKVKKQLSGSTKEALRLKKVNERLAELLAEQKIALVEGEDGIPADLAPAEGYLKDATATVKVDSFSDDERDLAASDPQKFADLVLAKAKKALVRIAPTVTKAIQPLSPERRESVEAHLSEQVFEDGSPRFPEFKERLGVVRKLVDSEMRSNPAYRDFFNQAPELAIESAFLKVQAAISHLRAAAARVEAEKSKKKDASRQTPDLPAGAGSGTPGLMGSGSTGQASAQLAKLMSQARR